MKNKIIVAGIGPGSIDYITPAALNAIKSAKILVGGRRALSYFATDNQKSCPITGDILAVVNFIREQVQISDVVVMASGDPGYYSILDTLRRESLPWHNATLLSFHGRHPSDDQLKYTPGKIIGMLTDGEYNSHTIPKILMSNNWPSNSKLAICARLSYSDEKILKTTLEDAATLEVVKHGILIVRESSQN